MTSSRDQDRRDQDRPPADAGTRRHRRRSVSSAIGAQTFIKVGLPAFHDIDFYRFAVSLNTRRFLLLFVAAELTINVVFASLYIAMPGAIANQSPKGFLGAFFFSLETLATVGYGEMYPGSLFGHIVSSIEILVGVGFTALMTGILFVRFSKPRARIVYAKQAVVTTVNGQPTLVFRMGNARAEPLHDTHVSLYALKRTITVEGIRQAHPVELHLLRDRMPVFAITWALMHVIDETSPLHGLDHDDEALLGLRFFLTLEGRDPALGQSVSDLHTFPGADIRYGMRYVDVVQALDEYTTQADFSLLSAIEPDPTSARDPLPTD